jgi:hypothetical protein
VYITVNEGGVKFNYGWLAPERIVSSAGAVLGIKPASAATDPILYGVNSPKPRKARKTQADGTTISTFVDDEAIDKAVKAGWKVTKSYTKRGLGSSKRTKSVMVPFTVAGANVFYAWRMNSQDFAAYGSKLGIVNADSTGKILIWGSTQKPARASKELPDGSIITAFCDIAKADSLEEDGWSIKASALVA